jgi:hypothetical protein
MLQDQKSPLDVDMKSESDRDAGASVASSPSASPRAADSDDDTPPSGHGSSPSTSTSDSSQSSDSSDSSSDSGSDSESKRECKKPGRPLSIRDMADALFPGSRVTVDQAVTLLLLHQQRFKTSNKAMIAMFDILRLLLPEDNEMVRFRHLESLLSDDKLEHVLWLHACVNDCVLFVNADERVDMKLERQHADKSHCPVCREARFNAAGTPRKVIGGYQQL